METHELKPIGDFLKKNVKKGANCKKNYYTDLISKMIDRPFKQTAGLLRNLREKDIIDLYEMSKSWEVNPIALFWKLLKKTRMK